MTIRIVFNGQEYASRDAMPDEVRKAYDEALAMFRDADADGVPDVLEAGGSKNVIGVHQTSVTFTGLPGGAQLPASVRRILESAGPSGQGSAGEVEPPGVEPSGAQNTLQTSIGLLLAFVAGFVLVFGVVLIFVIGGGRSHLASRLAVAVAALLLLGWLDTHATRLAKRRQPLLGPDSPDYRSFVVWSAAGLALAAVLLLGLAWFLP